MAKNVHRNGGSTTFFYRFHLYVAGASMQSRRAIMRINEIGRRYLDGSYELQVVDILQNPEKVAEAGVVATPTLIKTSPPPVRYFVGDLSDTKKIVTGLAITATD